MIGNFLTKDFLPFNSSVGLNDVSGLASDNNNDDGT